MEGYSNLNHEGFEHKTVNHSKFFKDTVRGIHTNTIEGLWNGIKGQSRSRIRSEHIEDRLMEFICRKMNQEDFWQEFFFPLSLPINK